MDTESQIPELVSQSKFQESLKKFKAMVAANQSDTERPLSFQDGYLKTQEGFKRVIFDKAGLSIKNQASLKHEDRESIKKKYLTALDDKENILVDRRFDKKKYRSLLEREGSDDLIYQIYTSDTDEDEELFNKATTLWGQKFPLITFTFFLKDIDNYVPVRPTTVKKGLECIGANSECMKPCTWENYQKFIKILREVQRLLNEDGGFSPPQAELIDAHSFLWMLQKTEDEEDMVSEDMMSEDMMSEDMVSEDLLKYKDCYNMLFYGVPGSGKSHRVNEIIKADDADDADDADNPEFSRMERVVFHPEYSYSDFIGQILPQVTKEGGVNYAFAPGPFTRILKAAVQYPKYNYYLVIEEINRGNAPAIFGDVFQLLDREDGESIYSITNADIAKVVYGDSDGEVKIPANLKILATMNTSDQNVFTLDTAFQRRWDMELILNNIGAAKHAKSKIEKTNVTWEKFVTVINEQILSANEGMLSSEDKRLGAYFVREDELDTERFSQKVLKYLWDDAFKMERTSVFKEKFKSLEDVVEKYREAANSGDDPLEAIFNDDVYPKMAGKQAGGGNPEEPSTPEET